MSRFDLRGAVHDVAGEGPARRMLVVWTTPRTSSSTLCEAMGRAGWGVPTEYFTLQYRLDLLARWSGGPVAAGELDARAAEYGRHLLEHRVRGGTFATKLFPDQAGAFEASLGGAGLPSHHVLLTRRDKAAQVVSLLAVYLTKQPFEDESRFDTLPGIAAVDERAALSLYRWLCLAEARWRRRLAGEARVAEVVAEDFLADPGGGLARIAAAIGFEAPPAAAAEVAAEVGPYATNAGLKAELAARFLPMLEDVQRREAPA